MEQLILYMTVKGLGTCYLGGSRVKQTVKNGKRLVMIAAFGWPEGKLYRESPLAKRPVSYTHLDVYKRQQLQQLQRKL